MKKLGAFGLAGLPGVWFDRLTRNAGWGWLLHPAGCGSTRPAEDGGPAHHQIARSERRVVRGERKTREDGRVGVGCAE